MADRLQPILEAKRAHVAARKAVRPAAALDLEAHGPPRGFAAALLAARTAGRTGLIAEVKKASPSRGLIRAEFRPAEIAAAYAAGGATCLSVLTDMPFFQGDDRYLAEARAAAPLPALRKDFMVDRYQIVESRSLGADAVLLIAAALAPALMQELAADAMALGMDVLVEVHAEAELADALAIAGAIVGINNRNLKTMAVDLKTAIRLTALVPMDRLVVAESGIGTPADVARLRDAGITTLLVGEALMREADVAAATRRLLAA